MLLAFRGVSTTRSSPARCSDKRDLASIALPVHGTHTRIRPSKAGRWRALVLVLVHVLIALHVAHWMRTGSTLSPLEPSESMVFSKESIVNAGFIFFALMIAGTLVLGRWFCGWACHLVALQDGSRWLLHKLGIKPRMINLGILGLVPWLAFVYMFLAPIVQRALVGDDLAARGTQLMTQQFWATFPNWLTAAVQFLFLGFVTVYFLGSKGFCNYGCPYGGIFGVADQLAPMRIRVTDACDGCGHCTAVCTSNVKVHEEVRDWKMVVDPACMKCLDCVSVCPNDALYVGFGVPAIMAKKRSAKKPEPASGGSSAAGLGRWIVLVVFVFGTISVFLKFDTQHDGFDLRLATVLSAGSLAVAALFKSKARRKSEYTPLEEALLGALFLLGMFAFRGYNRAATALGVDTINVPFLFSLGLSATLAYLAVQALRSSYKINVSVQRHALRISSKLTRGGAVFLVALVPVGWLWWDAGSERHAAWSQQREARERAIETQLRSREIYNQGVKSANEQKIDQAIDAFRQSLELDPTFIDARGSLARVLCQAGRPREGVEQCEIALKQNPKNATMHEILATALVLLGDPIGSRSHLETALELAPTKAQLHTMLGQLCEELGDHVAAKKHFDEARRLEEISPH